MKNLFDSYESPEEDDFLRSQRNKFRDRVNRQQARRWKQDLKVVDNDFGWGDEDESDLYDLGDLGF